MVLKELPKPNCPLYPAPMLDHSDPWLEQEHTCYRCGWIGLGAALVKRAMTFDFSQLCCPSCGEELEILLAADVPRRRPSDPSPEADAPPPTCLP
jgi:hypothetical protein